MIDSAARRARQALLACTVAFAATLPLRPALAADSVPPTTIGDAQYCGSIGFADQPNDFRLRESDQRVKWAYADNWKYHSKFAWESVRAGTFTEPVMAAINWTLVRWPNHLQMLEALIRYDMGGGQQYEYLPPECYFFRARQFAPNDTDVVLAQAYFFWKRKDFERAVASYEEVLKLNPDSSDAHYNLGLLYFERRDYDKSLEHAQAAYGAGYALPGLRKKLEGVGRWKTAQAH